MSCSNDIFDTFLGVPHILRIFRAGVRNILGYYVRGYKKNWGCQISYDTGPFLAEVERSTFVCSQTELL